MQLNRLVSIFNESLGKEYGAVLMGGFSEPCYIPCERQLDSSIMIRPAEIQFTKDFIRSALHEVAHWCIAGEYRRNQTDYGYWYRPDGRNELEQKEFFKVEVKPQAIEKIFSEHCLIDFRVSCDNLGGIAMDEKAFEDAVDRQVALYMAEGLPDRAQKFIEAIVGSELKL